MLATEIGLRTDPASLARCVALGRPRPVTLGVANGRRFILMAGAGFDAHVVAGVSVPMKRRLGKGAYVLSTLRQLLVFTFPSYEVLIDNTAQHAASVIVANGRYYGGRFVCAPDASLESATLRVCLFERSGRRATIGYALAMFTGRLPKLSSFRVIEARRIEIRGRPGEPLQGATSSANSTLRSRSCRMPSISSTRRCQTAAWRRRRKRTKGQDQGFA